MAGLWLDWIRAASLTPYSKHCDAPTLPSFLPEYIKSFYWGKVFLICSLLKFFMILSWLVLQLIVRFECFKVKHKISSGLSLLTDQTPSCLSCLSGLSSGVGAEDVWVVLWLQELLWGQSKAAGLPEDPHSCEETHTSAFPSADSLKINLIWSNWMDGELEPCSASSWWKSP